jgi:hypothetical protein
VLVARNLWTEKEAAARAKALPDASVLPLAMRNLFIKRRGPSRKLLQVDLREHFRIRFSSFP